jgi:hypothetical protein
MKKLKKSISTYLPTAKIFLDDVEKIEEILRESCSSYNLPFNKPKLDLINKDKEIYKLIEELQPYPYTIKLDEEYELHSISEIKEIEDKQDFHNLEILLMKPFFNLEFDEFNSHIYCDDDSLCLGILEKIKPIILKRKTRFLHGLYGVDKKFIVFTTKKSNEQSNYFIENKDELITKLFFGIVTTATGIFIGNKVIPWFTSLLNGQ